ncbi:MAG: 17 kDa surface antigen [Verrucomicrobiales bacterium]|nr:17 kDa surface antigen [Verrucomicrobiales bacterium]
MKTFVLTSLAAALLVTGCENPNGSVNRTGTGALIGAGGGAALGAALGGRNAGAGALIGGALGAATGAIVGNVMDQNEAERLRAQAPQTYERIEQAQPLYPQDIKAMVASGVPDNVIISLIQRSVSIYHLIAADIIVLHQAGVSHNVMYYMINTANGAQFAPEPVVTAAPPPAPQQEVIVASPGPGYVWVGGEWVWRGRWVWAPGHWVSGPRPGAVWVGGVWVHGGRGWYHRGGHWRY